MRIFKFIFLGIGVLAALLFAGLYLLGSSGGPKAGLYSPTTHVRLGYIKEREEYFRINFALETKIEDGKSLEVYFNDIKTGYVHVVNSRIKQRLYKKEMLHVPAHIAGGEVRVQFNQETVAKGNFEAQ